MTAVILASASPSRLTLLQAAGIEPTVSVSGVDEDAVVAHAQQEAGRALTVAEQTQVLATAKGRAVLAALSDDVCDGLLIAADSMLELNGVAVGKPGTPERAREVWKTMAGQSAVLHSGHFLARIDSTAAEGPSPARTIRTAEAVGSTTIHTAALSDAEIEAYISTREPLAVAGGLTIDGYGSAFITGMDGDHTNVMGLSIPLLRTLCSSLGLQWHTLWNRPSGASI